MAQFHKLLLFSGEPFISAQCRPIIYSGGPSCRPVVVAVYEPKYRLEKKPIAEVLRGLERSFNVFPVVTRDCVRALNTLIYNLQGTRASPEAHKQIVFLVLRGFTSSDMYLKNYIYTVLIELGRLTRDGILAINCIIKDLDNRKCPESMKNTALRALFSNLPPSMYYDFEKYVKAGIIDGNDNSVVVAIEYFQESRVPSRVLGTIQDFHQSFFNRLPVNRYSGMIEVERIAKESFEQLSSFLFISADVIVFLEAAKRLAGLRPERAAPFVEKGVHVLAALLKRPGAESFAAIKILGELSVSFPAKVAKANLEIENLVHSPCRCVSMIAILTLLKTGTAETVTKLAAKLEPLMQSMSDGYKRMAIDTMEKLSLQQSGDGSCSGSYFAFLKKALMEKGDLKFKKYIIKKVEELLRVCTDQQEIIKFLCGYLEDPEYYQISMDVLGILGQYLQDARDLVHVYNRLILDNCHVRKCAIQTLYDLERPAHNGNSLGQYFGEAVVNFRDDETRGICDFLTACEGLKGGAFSISELGDLKMEVMKYLDEEEQEAGEPEGDLIKECRPVTISPEGADVTISLVKKVYRSEMVLGFRLENKMERVKLGYGLLSIEINDSKYSCEVDQADFENGTALKEINAAVSEGDVGYGVFEYQVYVDDDMDDVDNDSIPLEPFSFTIFDFVRPAHVTKLPENCKSIQISLDCKMADAASRIIGITNLSLTADRNSLSMGGTYNGTPVGIEATMRHSKVTTVDMDIYCEPQDVLDALAAVFE